MIFELIYPNLTIDEIGTDLLKFTNANFRNRNGKWSAIKQTKPLYSLYMDEGDNVSEERIWELYKRSYFL